MMDVFILMFLVIGIIGLFVGYQFILQTFFRTKKRRHKLKTAVACSMVPLLLSVLFWALVPVNLLVVKWPSRSNMNPTVHKNWIGAWSSSSQKPYLKGVSHQGFKHQTLRMVIHPHLSGRSLRLRFSNIYGTTPLSLAKVHVAVSGKKADIKPGTDRTVTFNGRKSTTIATGKQTVSDSVPLHVKAGKNLTVSVYVANQSGPTTWHAHSNQATYIMSGEHAADTHPLTPRRSFNAWFWMNGVDVAAKPSTRGAVVAIGDSITDGSRSRLNTNHRWPDYFAERFNRMPENKQMSVLNEGLYGNRIFADGPRAGPSLLHRMERDALEQTGATDVVLLEGIDDIRHHPEYDPDRFIEAMKQIIKQTHARGLKIMGGTLLPYKRSEDFSSKGEKVREKVNQWIRSSADFDGYIDFDKVLRAPHHPHRMLAKFDSGDHLHPNDAGYRAMAQAMDLSKFGINDAADINKIVTNYRDVGAIDSPRAVRDLNLRLKRINLFEQHGEERKALHYLRGFKTILSQQKHKDWISNHAFHTLKRDTNSLIRKTKNSQTSKGI